MSVTPPNDHRDPLRPRRRYSIWTILAPVALLVFVFATFNAIGESCLFKECRDEAPAKAKDDGAAKRTKAGAKRRDNESLPTGMRYTVKAGDNASAIAADFDITVDELQACNPKADITILPEGMKLFVAPARCRGADLAEAGANPDPFADDTNVGSVDIEG